MGWLDALTKGISQNAFPLIGLVILALSLPTLTKFIDIFREAKWTAAIAALAVAVFLIIVLVILLTFTSFIAVGRL